MLRRVDPHRGTRSRKGRVVAMAAASSPTIAEVVELPDGVL